ncbi:MAG: SH3 domain-containing protein [Clostridium sp.]
MKSKKIIAMLGTAIILSGTAFTSITAMAATPNHTTKAVTQQAKSSEMMTVTANGLNVRAKASTNSSKLGILTKGTKVTVLAKEGNWSKISFNGKTGYVSSQYLSMTMNQGTQTKPQMENKMMMVTSNGLNVRAKASMNSSKLGVLTKGTKVTVLAKEGNWSKISFNGKTGYVSSQYLSMTMNQGTQTKPQMENKMMTVVPNGLNVRAKASMDSSKLGVLTKGTKVTVLAKEGNWSKISFNGKTGYVSSQYLSMNQMMGQAKPQMQNKMMTVTANGLNVRAKASMNSSKLGILPKGTKITVLAKEGNWSKISFNGKTGYVSSQYLK